MTNPKKLQHIQDTNKTQSVYSSSDTIGTTLEEQLDYIKLTTKEIVFILWNSWRDYFIRQRNNNRADTN
jgi:hypothetical protein